eukprot:jgi/Psemu1/291789/fgenesh1_pg.811_\
MGLQAAEQLVSQLAANRVGTDLKPTNDQQELNIPRFLVYLLGIVIAEDEYQQWMEQKPMRNDTNTEPEHAYCFSSTREKRFAAFQKQYWASVSEASAVHSEEQKSWISSSLGSNPYKLSTRVYPSEEQKAIVKRDLLNECEKLESLSNAALATLLEEESSSLSSSRNTSKRRRGGKKKKRKQSNRQKQFTIAVEDALKSDGEVDKPNATTGEEPVAETLVCPSVDSIVEESARAESRRKDDGCEMKNSSTMEFIFEAETKSIMSQNGVAESLKDEDGNAAEKDNTDDDSRENEDSPQANAHTLQIGTVIEGVSSPLGQVSNILLISNPCSDQSRFHHVATNDFELTKQTQRIVDLEREMLDAKSKLSTERLAHVKVLQKEKERYENMIQALQLRLYISENKLRTYEEALENHVKAVSTVSRNKCTGNRSNIEESTPCSPSLISKVLENKKENVKTGHSIW